MTAPIATSPSCCPCRPNFSTSAPSVRTDMPRLPTSAYAVFCLQKGMRTPPRMATGRPCSIGYLVECSPRTRRAGIMRSSVNPATSGANPRSRTQDEQAYAGPAIARRPRAGTRAGLGRRAHGAGPGRRGRARAAHGAGSGGLRRRGRARCSWSPWARITTWSSCCGRAGRCIANSTSSPRARPAMPAAA